METFKPGMENGRLNILLAIMMIAVIGMLFFVYQTIQHNTKATVDIYRTQLERLLKKQDAQYKEQVQRQDEQYQQYKSDRDRDFKEFTDKTINVLTSTLNQIRTDEDNIISLLHAELEKQNTKISEDVSHIEQKVEQNPKIIEHKTIEHKTEVISEDELKRREKVKAEWREYRQKLQEYRRAKHKP